MSFDFAPSGAEACAAWGLSQAQRKRVEQFHIASRNCKDARGILVFIRVDDWIAAQIVAQMFEADGKAKAWEGGEARVRYVSEPVPERPGRVRIKAEVKVDGETYELGIETADRHHDKNRYDSDRAALKQTVSILCALPAAHRPIYMGTLRQ